MVSCSRSSRQAKRNLCSGKNAFPINPSVLGLLREGQHCRKGREADSERPSVEEAYEDLGFWWVTVGCEGAGAGHCSKRRDTHRSVNFGVTRKLVAWQQIGC